MSIPINNEVRERLALLTNATERSRSFLAAGAVCESSENNKWQTRKIRTALKDADAGDFASDDDVVAITRKWKASAA